MSEPDAANIEEYLKHLKLPDIARHFPEVEREAEKDAHAYFEFLRVLLEGEIIQSLKISALTPSIRWFGNRP